jgi:hypothetical protein
MSFGTVYRPTVFERQGQPAGRPPSEAVLVPTIVDEEERRGRNIVEEETRKDRRRVIRHRHHISSYTMSRSIERMYRRAGGRFLRLYDPKDKSNGFVVASL